MTAADLLAWLTANDTPLADCRQADIDNWLLTSSGACQVREFLTWAAERNRCLVFQVPAPNAPPGPPLTPISAGR